MDAEPASLTPDQRNAMRAFLQRSEVRLSTMHRIVTAFVSGAGLMILIPVFFKDVIDGIIEVMLANAGNVFPASGAVGGSALSALLYATLSYPLLLSVAIPLYAVYLLIKDIVHFYFTVYMPGYPDALMNPTLSLSGLTFPEDEAPEAKARIMRYAYQPENSRYMIPFSTQRRRQYFNELAEATAGDILPRSRAPERLAALGVLTAGADPEGVTQVNAALGIARSLDRTLEEEVALTEMALTRNVLYIRRLLMRYVKALLMFIWTMLVSFIMLPFLHDDRLPVFLVLALGYLVWSLAVLRIMRLPVNWIYRHRQTEPANRAHIDAQLQLMDRNVRGYCRVSAVLSALSVLLALLASA